VLLASALPDAVTNVAVATLRIRGALRDATLLNGSMATIAVVGAWLLTPRLGSSARAGRGWARSWPARSWCWWSGTGSGRRNGSVRMRILHLSDFYRPTIGGLERHVETLSREFIELGHEVDVVTLQVGDRPAHEVCNGVRVHRISGWSAALAPYYADPSRPFHPTAPDPGVMATLRRIVAVLKPDVVHSHSWLQYSYFPLYRRHSGPAHVATLHDYGLACAKKTFQHNDEQWCDGPRWPSACDARPASTAR